MDFYINDKFEFYSKIGRKVGDLNPFQEKATETRQSDLIKPFTSNELLAKDFKFKL